MKSRLLIVLMMTTICGSATLVFHPGVASASPRFAEAAASEFAGKAEYAIDPAHADISFEIMHMELSRVRGRFNKFSGTVIEDPSDLTKSSVTFSAEIASMDTAIPARDQHLQAAEFFDAAKHPVLTFKSTKVEKRRGGYAVIGKLSFKGTTKQITIPFRHFGPYTLKGMGEQPERIGVIASPIKIKRSDFGIGSTAPLPDGRIGASDEVVIQLSFEGIRN